MLQRPDVILVCVIPSICHEKRVLEVVSIEINAAALFRSST